MVLIRSSLVPAVLNRCTGSRSRGSLWTAGGSSGGGVGLRGYGEISHWIPIVSSCVLFPLVLLICRPSKTEDGASRQLKWTP